jgi:hypothetical protein
MPILVLIGVYPPILVAIDKRIRFKPEGRAARLLRLLLRFSIIRVLSVVGPGMLTLITNLPRRLIRPIIILVAMGTLTLVFAEAYFRRTGISTVGQWFVPAERAASTIDYQFYEDRAPANSDPRVPRIQSDVITQPYVRLLIPYYARRDNDAIAQGCPSIDPKLLESDEGIDPDPRATDAVLQCVAKLRDVRVDDAPLPGTQFRFFRDPRTGLNGFVTYMPTSTMIRGAHVLTVRQMPRANNDPAKPVQAYRIWFWI